MGKQAKKVAVEAATVEAVTLQGATHTTTPAIVHIKSGAKVNLRGARALWYAKLVEFSGQPAAEFLAACATTPPSLPKSGKAEPAQGWLRWFVANGYAEIK